MTDNVIALKPRPKAKLETSRALAFTNAALRKLVADPATPPSLADSKQPGLFLRRAKSGRWAFVFERRIEKRLYRQTITQWADRVDLDLLRQDAANLLRDAQTGNWADDVVAPKVDPRIEFDWAQAFADHIRINEIRLNTQKQYAAAIRAFGPSLPKRVGDLTGPLWRAAFMKAKDQGLTLADGKKRILGAATASAYARCLSAVYDTWAFGFEEAQRPSGNPIKSGMQTGPQKTLWKTYDPRTGRLTLGQVASWLQALRQQSLKLDPTHASALAALEMITLTGMRSGEILGLTWAEVQGGIIKIAASRMKAKVAFTRPITRRVAVLLDAQREITGGVGFVFPSWKAPSTHLVDVRKAMIPVASAVGAGDLTPHDLRRTFVSIAKEQRVDAGIVKRLVGHSLKADVTESAYTAGIDPILLAEAQRLEDVMLAGEVA